MKINIEIEDIQEKIFIDDKVREHIIYTLEKTLEEVGADIECEVYVLLIDDAKMREINNDTRNIDSTTDVLSFPLNELDDGKIINELEINPETNNVSLGDIVISIEKAQAQADEYGHDIGRELCFLSMHGLLHLLGYDHCDKEREIKMFDLQKQIIDKR